MLRYYAAAAGLKAFSVNGVTKKAYRSISNQLGARRRSRTVRAGYFQRSQQNLQFIEANHGIAHGMRVLELGTGWVHWEALFTSAFYDVQFVLFDVWDNRQFAGFQFYASQLKQRMRSELPRSEAEFAHADAVLDKVARARDFPQVYDALGWTYLIEGSGSLAAIADASLDLVISSDVLEHVHRDAVPQLARDHMRVLRPNGRAAHQIVFNDHLRIYDQSVHPKNYLRMSDRHWRLWAENDVQYINRLQPSEFEAMFTAAGLAIDDARVTDRCGIETIALSDRFARFSREDLETSVKSLLLRKPADPPPAKPSTV